MKSKFNLQKCCYIFYTLKTYPNQDKKPKLYIKAQGIKSSCLWKPNPTRDRNIGLKVSEGPISGYYLFKKILVSRPLHTLNY